MKQVRIVVEGATEHGFVRAVLAPWLSARGVLAHADLVGQVGHKGGNVRWERLGRDIVRTLKRYPEAHCSTMVDFYGLPKGFPGKDDAPANASGCAKAQKVEDAVRSAVLAEMSGGFNPGRFIPYVQAHEFEALLFSAPAFLAGTFPAQKPLEERLLAIRGEFATPEDINDRRDTSPSHRILGLVAGYKKAYHGPLVAKEIGLDRMRHECPHFDQWVSRLESLGTAV